MNQVTIGSNARPGNRIPGGQPTATDDEPMLPDAPPLTNSNHIAWHQEPDFPWEEDDSAMDYYVDFKAHVDAEQHAEFLRDMSWCVREALDEMDNDHPEDEHLYSGLLVFGPMGVGKTSAINAVHVPGMVILDGNELCKKHGIVNQNRFWYPPADDPLKWADEREAILNLFETYLIAGNVILYSGNPNYIRPDVLVMIDKGVRWSRLQSRQRSGGYCPSWEHFNLEERTYYDYIIDDQEGTPIFNDVVSFLRHLAAGLPL